MNLMSPQTYQHGNKDKMNTRMVKMFTGQVVTRSRGVSRPIINYAVALRRFSRRKIASQLLSQSQIHLSA